MFQGRFYKSTLCFVVNTESGRNYEPRREDEFYSEREGSFSVGEPPKKWSNNNKRFANRSRGASQAARTSANPKTGFSAQDRREKPGRGAGRPNAKPPGMIDP